MESVLLMDDAVISNSLERFRIRTSRSESSSPGLGWRSASVSVCQGLISQTSSPHPLKKRKLVKISANERTRGSTVDKHLLSVSLLLIFLIFVRIKVFITKMFFQFNLRACFIQEVKRSNWVAGNTGGWRKKSGAKWMEAGRKINSQPESESKKLPCFMKDTHKLR